AMTVTGLVVVDTGSAFTMFGELVIALLIQLGGLGIMTFAVIITIVLGKRIGIKERLLIRQALNQDSLGGIVRLVKYLFVFSVTIELIAMIFLSIRWIPELGWGRGIYYSFFHAISGFNNAGFALWSDSLMGYVGDPIVNLVITLLFIIGGIGFTVLSDLWVNKKFKKLSLHTKMMLVGTLLLNTIAMLLIFILEYSNPNTLGSLATMGDKLWASYFQALTPRTAGFNTLDIASLQESTIFLILLLMFIGAGTASTGGGIKLTTFMVMVFSVITFLRGRQEIVIGRRSITKSVILRSLAITMLGFSFVFLGVFILTITEDAPFIIILFEVISAFGTVGLSMGLTGSLTFLGKFVIILIMFLGKVGPLTLAFSIAKPVKAKIRYPSDDIYTG
ncbi:MAG TPA: TrkH family potassium uptake protein, partial [Bacteroidales bacterium]|nr:TrkH family potassium uptake protein [Bacteroidales bacterium]